MTKSVAIEVAPLGIRVNCVSPGGMDTAILRQPEMGEIDLEAIMAREVPLARSGRPDEVGRVVVFLLSDGASYVTGRGLGRRRWSDRRLHTAMTRRIR